MDKVAHIFSSMGSEGTTRPGSADGVGSRTWARLCRHDMLLAMSEQSEDRSGRRSRVEERWLAAARGLFERLGGRNNERLSVRLWDGSRVPLSSDGDADTPLYIAIAGPGVLGSLLRRPTPENMIRQYATGGIELRGGSPLELLDMSRDRSRTDETKASKVRLAQVLRKAWPLVLAHGSTSQLEAQEFAGDSTGRRQASRNNIDFIQFHYDVSNAFYSLFLDSEMQYSCGYFTAPESSLETAQRDKLEMICRKLRLAPGERFLDIGCGWGGLICYAAQNYGVEAHGVTLSQAQYDFAVEKVQRLGLGDRVTVELIDYSELEGQYDKIASIGMFEHIGLKSFPHYFGQISTLLRDRGVVLNHGIASRDKRRRRRRIRPEKRLLKKYIFPGSELASIGHALREMEHAGFEIHDVEGWREHYARTTRHWHDRLYARRDEAVDAVGIERYRLWQAYLAGVAHGFTNGSILVFQTVATKHSSHGLSGLPPTRADLYG